MCPLKVRVGANSPSLCPTIASVTNTGTCLRPSCTAKVCPMKSGMMVERRDQVLMTCLLFFSFCTSTFFKRWSSTNGPFFRLRGIGYLLPVVLLAGAPASDDELVAWLVRLAGTALGLTPRADRVTAAGGLTLAAAVRVVDRVHDDTADGRALALPPHAAGLAPVDVGLLGVADPADRGAAAHVDVAHLAGGHAQLGAAALLGDELRRVASGAGDLRAATGPQLDAVDRRTDGDVAQRQVVARLDVGLRAGLDRRTLAEVLRRDDVALLAVRVVQQRDARRAVGVVLDVRDLGRDAVLVVATEVHDAVGALVTAALVTRRDPALVVAAALLGERAHQRLLRRRPRHLDEVGDRRATTARGGRLVLTDAHEFSVLDLFPSAGQETGPPKMSMRWPAARLTIARLVLARLPIPKRVRRVLP